MSIPHQAFLAMLAEKQQILRDNHLIDITETMRTDIQEASCGNMKIDEPLKGKGYPYNEKTFKPHMMYDPKTGKGYEAKTYQDHLEMKKKGYDHEKPEVKEDTEQVDELKVKTLRSYISKAQKDNTQRVIRMTDKPSHMKADKGEMKKLRKRQKGVANAKTDIAMRRIAGKDYRKRMGEDVELDELKMPKGGLEKGTFKNPALMLKLLTTGGKGKRKRKVEEEKKDKIKVKLDPKKKIGYEVRSVGPGGKTTVTKRRDMPGQEDVGEASAAWQRKEGKNKEGGLNAAGRASYERENPGSDLKAPVSAEQAKKSKGGKAAKRRKSFCARMGGMPGAMKDEKGRPTRKALALRKWDC